MFKEYSQEMAENIIKAIWNIEVKQMEDKYSMTITSEVEDRDWEVVRISWIDFSNYLKNPVVLQDHSYKVEDIVWKTISLKKDWQNLIAEFVFTNTEYWVLAKELYDNGFLKTSSIWFIPLERDATNRSIITKCELLEWSLVAVPCNPEALSMDWKALYQKWVEAWILKDFQEEKKQEENKLNLESELKFVKDELSEIKTILKNLANDNAELKQFELDKQNQEQMKKQAQELVKGLSAFLCEAKKSV